MDADGRPLLNSVPTPAISWDSKTNLRRVKTSLNAKCVKLIQQEASILKTLKHPLVIEFHLSGANRITQQSLELLL
jgi:hypothetical protein